MATGVALAQQQEQGLLERIDANRRKALDAMKADGKPKKRKKSDTSLVSPLASRSFETGSKTGIKTFNTDKYGGTKDASVKTYATRSFLGVKNPWFGRKVYETNASALAKRDASDARRQFETDAYETKKFGPADKDSGDAQVEVPARAEPRPYLVAPKAQGGVDQFTQNLKKDLSIDDVRDLLNRGKGK